MIKSLIFTILLLAGFIILFAVVRIIGAEEIIRSFLEFSPWGIIPLLVFTLANHIMAAIKWQYILRALGVRVELLYLFKIWLAGYAVSYITPVAYIGGEFFRGYALQDKYKVSWPKSLSSISIDKIVEASVWVIVIVIGIIIYLFQAGTFSFSRILIASAASSLVFIGGLLIIYIFSFRKKSLVGPLILKPFKLHNSKSAKFLSEIENEFFKFFSFDNSKVLLVSFQLAILKNIFLWFRNLFLIYYLINILSYSGSIVTLASSYLGYSLPIPALLGVHEAILSFVFSGIGLGAGPGAVFALLTRAADVLIVIVGLVYLFKWGIGFFAFRIARIFKINDSKTD